MVNSDNSSNSHGSQNIDGDFNRDSNNETGKKTINHTSKQTQHSRVKVVHSLVSIQQGQSLSNLLDEVLDSSLEIDKGFVHTLLLTSLRHWHATARLLDSLADKPIDEVKVRAVIQVGITQLLYLDVAEHAAIYETVETVKQLGLSRASGLVNAILRKVAKNPNKFRKKCDKNHSLPNWLAKQLKQDWITHYNELVQALRQPALMFLRVNPTQITINDYQTRLSEHDIASEVIRLTTELITGSTVAPMSRSVQPSVDNSSDTNQHQKFHVELLALSKSTSVKNLPEFTTGMVSVQDAHAQLSGAIIHQLLSQIQQIALLNNKDNTTTSIRFLDACTAPGGKLAHVLELTCLNNKSISTSAKNAFHVKHNPITSPQLSITAIDQDDNRLKRTEQNLHRLGWSDRAKLVCADASNWQGEEADDKDDSVDTSIATQGYDVILLDAPCTATGVIRRHPDISILRQETDIDKTVKLQKDILDNLWKQLRPQGYLLYVTCSILKAENEQQMQNFLNLHKDAREVPLKADWGIEQTVGRQCLPMEINGGDGFYYALLQKCGNS